MRYILIGIIAAVFVGAGERIYGIVGMVSTLAVASVFYYLFSRYLWKLGILHKLSLVSVPDLNGHWKGYLYTSQASENIDDSLIVDTGKQIDGLTKMESEIYIDQTWDKIRITLDGPESPSYSKGATVLVNERAWPTITYNYLNEGSTTNDNLDMHYGTTTLQYNEEEEKLEGPYYTRPDQRGNSGFVELERVNKR